MTKRSKRKKRKSPHKHLVSGYKRNGYWVKPHHRGRGEKPHKRIVLGYSPPNKILLERKDGRPFKRLQNYTDIKDLYEKWTNAYELHNEATEYLGEEHGSEEDFEVMGAEEALEQSKSDMEVYRERLEDEYGFIDVEEIEKWLKKHKKQSSRRRRRKK